MQAFINDTPVTFEEGETILSAARRLDIFIPTLCEFAALSHTPGTCRVCLVEIEGGEGEQNRIVTSCDTRLTPGMRVKTRTRRVRAMQKLQVELIFADHGQDCISCPRHGDCELQTVGMWVGLDATRLSGRYMGSRTKDDSSMALNFSGERCIRCMRCIEVCRQVQGIGALTLNGIGTNAGIGFGDNRRWVDSERCIQCGQCTLVCPTGALSVKGQEERAIDFLEDDNIVTVFEIAPAVRVALAEEFGLPSGTNLEGKIVAALKSLGADFVMDTRWAADVTIMEEGTEVLTKLARAKGESDKTFPVFTSCCPGWVNYVEKLAPDMIPHLSSTRSPQAIFGAVAKSWFPKVMNIPKEQLRVISVMPCTAKKDEAARKTLAREDGSRDVDLVLTVRELARLFRRLGVNIQKLSDTAFDTPLMTRSSGAAQLFATTGGVMEAAIRTMVAKTTGQELQELVFEPVRGLKNTKEASVNLGELGTIRVAVVHELKSVEAIIEGVRAGTSPYHFVEVMACPGGCIGGGGTSRGKAFWKISLASRQEEVYDIDSQAPIRAAHLNPEVLRLYSDFLGEPNGEKAHTLLHCHYQNRATPLKAPSVHQIFKRLELTGQ